MDDHAVNVRDLAGHFFKYFFEFVEQGNRRDKVNIY